MILCLPVIVALHEVCQCVAAHDLLSRVSYQAGVADRSSTKESTRIKLRSTAVIAVSIDAQLGTHLQDC